MKRAALVTTILVLGTIPAIRAQPQTVPCASYYISEITLVSTADGEAGHVQTFVGFGPSREEAENKALGWCSRVRFDLETCLNSDRITARNAPSDGSSGLLHLKYMKAVARVTGCG
ncbi:hypothetical protein JQ617_11920 [Bradyrhizobium sp. KB893862 SZCCT0404]|uniref:hypothetical protein n=1 Tax=Bradyrhizobium sp. KB893862 SZCCT0404 TaxID=2807672 RepID=UPI001BA64FC9|nr:hypothetical protein [Bradyrhizobium sp. KB893862 SZCCT0404]MBR1174665.1 hypothetical protein [Bradyrhizobium sp. KB893862 SZCCT0404]